MKHSQPRSCENYIQAVNLHKKGRTSANHRSELNIKLSIDVCLSPNALNKCLCKVEGGIFK